MLLLGLLVQVLAAIAPPRPTLSLSNNDLVKGGIRSQQEAIELCSNNAYDFATILSHFNISCDDLSKAQIIKIYSTDYSRNFYSLGRLPYGSDGETIVSIPGLGVFYMRPLWAWRNRESANSYEALSSVRNDRKPFMIILANGNLVVSDYGDVAVDTACAADQRDCLVKAQSVRNNTRNVQDTSNIKAQGGDNLTYTLSVKNSGTQPVKGFVIEENISDILEYIDASNIDLRGGLKDNKNAVRWPAANIHPGETIRQELSVTIRNPIPQTPISTSDPASHDLMLTNVFGNATNVKLPLSFAKRTEQISLALPSIGVNNSILVSFLLTLFSCLLFIRNRLVLKEIGMVRHEYAKDGGL